MGQTRTSSLGAVRPLPRSADIGPGGEFVRQAAQFCLVDVVEQLGKGFELSRGRSRWRRSKLPVATLIVGALSTVYRCRSMAATASVL